MDLTTIATKLGTEEQCLELLEAMRWPECVRCVAERDGKVCDSDKITKMKVKATTRKVKRGGVVTEVPVPARHLYQCGVCRHQFTATAGTLFNDSHLPLTKWFFAVALMINAKKGLSARQMARDLKVTNKTGWYLCHRIREAMESDRSLFGGTVELDETFVGGRYDARRHRERWDKQPVMGIASRPIEDEPSRIHSVSDPESYRASHGGSSQDLHRSRRDPLH